MMILASLLALLTMTPAPGGDEVVARASDMTLTRADFGEWFIARQGVPQLRQFLEESLILREARRRDLYPTEESVIAEWEAERAQVIQLVHQGREDRWIAEIEARGYTVESWKDFRCGLILVEQCEAALAQADRVVTEDAIAKRYHDTYGDAGEHTTVEVLFFSAYRDVDPTAPRPDIAKLKQAAHERARAAAQAWAAGRTLDQLAADGDPIHSEFVQDGRVETWKRDLLGPAVDRAVNSLDQPGDVSPPVDGFDGSYVVRLVERRNVSFESVRDELAAMLRAEPANANERAEVRDRLMETYHGELMLR